MTGNRGSLTRTSGALRRGIGIFANDITPPFRNRASDDWNNVSTARVAYRLNDRTVTVAVGSLRDRVSPIGSAIGKKSQIG